MMKKHILRFIVSLMLVSLLVSGCSLFPATVTKTGALNVSVKLESSKGALDTLVLKTVTVSLTQGSKSLEGSADIVNGTATVPFSDLQAGTWNAAVTVTDDGGIVVYEGATTVGVTSGPTAMNVTVPMTSKAADLSVTATVPTGLGITKGTAVLVSGATTPPAPVDFTAGTAAGFAGLKSTSWTLKVSLKDVSGVVKAYGQKTVDLLPGRVNSCSLDVTDYETGAANVSLLIGAEPAVSAGVQATRGATGVAVAWTKPSDVLKLAGYSVYRSETTTGSPKLLNDTLVAAANSTYTDTSALASKAYYYWVRVYDVNGLSSDLSAFASVAGSGATYTNVKDGSKMVLIPAGAALVGDPKISVTLPAYYMGETEVTNAQYAAFLTDKQPNATDLAAWITLDSECFVEKSGAAYVAYGGKANHPVVKVSWFGAVAYAEWAGLRLPTELEWEKAARGTDGRTYPWGDTWDASKCSNSVGPKAVGTAEVGSYSSGDSPYGMKDMAGNVWEWCADWYEPGAYTRYQAGDLTAPNSGFGSRVLRGGAWTFNVENCFRGAYRTCDDPTRLYNHRGFRCAGTL